jgi:hypothetical protein
MPLPQQATTARHQPFASLRPLAYRWLKGPAWQDDDAVVLDIARAESYEPETIKTLGTALANVKTPAEAVAFVTQFGLLETGKDERATSLAADWHTPRRELTANFLTTAETMQRIMRMLRDVRKAHGGDEDAYERIRDSFGRDHTHERDRTRREALIYASDWAAWGLNDGLIGPGEWGTAPYVFDRAQQGHAVEPGLLRIGLLPATLRQACFMHFAMMLCDGDGDICPGCGRVFSRDGMRPDATFCSPRCGGKARQARKRERDRK